MRVFGLVGKTLKHSFSKKYFDEKFAREGITDCRYENFELQSVEDLPKLMEAHPGLEGLNITIPYKETCLSYLQEKNEIVNRIGACNCIRISNGIWTGYNTDAVAFRNSLATKLQPHHRCALVLGSGGASKAIQYALKELGLDFMIVSRHKKQNQLGYEDIGEETIQGHQVIINTTPVGMYPNVQDDPPIPYDAIDATHLLFDLTYNPAKTKFLAQGEERGAQIMNGYDMLLGQAEESWRIWNGKTIQD